MWLPTLTTRSGGCASVVIGTLVETTRLSTSLQRMAVIWASVIAVLGTLGGATASYLFQGKISERSQSTAHGGQLRQERLAAYSSFAGAVMDLRRTQYDLGYSRMTEDDRQLDRSSTQAESSRLRSVAWTAFYRFKLTSPDAGLTDLAIRAVEDALDVADGSDKADLKSRSAQARERINAFISAAAMHLEDANLSTIRKPGRFARRSLMSNVMAPEDSGKIGFAKPPVEHAGNRVVPRD